MKNFCKRLYYFVELLFQSIVSILSILLFSRLIVACRMTKQSKVPKKKNAIILGNGPSLKPILDSKLSELMNKDSDIAAVNFFCSSPYFTKIKPSLYVISDPAYFFPSGEEWIEKQKKSTIENLINIDWNMRLFIPANTQGTSMVKELAGNKHIKICFYNLVPVNAFKFLENYLFRNNLAMPHPENVLNCSIFLLINLRYDNIYILGADHTWLKEVNVNDKNEVLMGYEHFYGDTNVVKLNSTLSEWLHTQYICFKVHERLNEYASYMNVKVYNSTKGSFVDAYKREIIL